MLLHSMTGYGQVQLKNDQYQILVEIKCLNSKFLDLNLKLPKYFSEKEIIIRNLLSQKLERGKAMITIEFQRKSVNELPTAINESLFRFYYQHFQQLADSVGASKEELFKLALQAPDVMVTTLDNPSVEEDFEVLRRQIEEAIEKCLIFRAREGEELKPLLLEYAGEIDKNLLALEKYEDERQETVKDRLKNSLKELASHGEYDTNRFEQELIYYIEKLDITEEKVRLRSHLKYFRDILHSAGPHGKKLNFISQEIGREINTIGSKANHSAIQKHVVAMKEELEKIKEQVLNVV